ncbi:bifunctional alpha/beta hydrolase/OsmC family protein [Autumnicola psychrophila]|uniref:Bifunctional alpha/beta hydrolase/OsmC family protein n=1 Tax=Autumnicola psychrophila TaxID=3075592 RepID=A0ABU3DVB2_9FLAO|nr:bifunctional alpha/beta hydrolase/OsmC family protein [Zunongwangia sp. F225]MDT0687583.1 bifunctional alpha/beta hydrolase/OsmC family protein [Zunongwangia sp. F225]
MKTTKVTFKNKEGNELVGYLELPTNQNPHNFVLFAHCFTCNKNYFAPKNISRTIAAYGFGVLRFDFAGLGESEGDFSDTNFSGNVQDLVAAAEYLQREYKSPSVLVGHSLGGAAVLMASEKIESVKAVATIAAPSTITHVEGLLSEQMDKLKKDANATVNIGGRPFKIKKQFLEDLQRHDLEAKLSELEKAVLILHSPQDKIVEIKNAEELYRAVDHPKSFVSLDGADHLLNDREYSTYAGKVIATWAEKYVELEKAPDLETDHQVVANLGSDGFTTQVKAGIHNFIADEPVKVGGNNFGPTPYELLSAGLAACTSMTIQMYAKRKKWPVENVETHVSYAKQHASDCEDCDKDGSKIDIFEREIAISGDLDEKQVKRLLEIADKCPVHKTLSAEVVITTKLANA